MSSFPSVLSAVHGYPLLLSPRLSRRSFFEPARRKTPTVLAKSRRDGDTGTDNIESTHFTRGRLKTRRIGLDREMPLSRRMQLEHIVHTKRQSASIARRTTTDQGSGKRAHLPVNTGGTRVSENVQYSTNERSVERSNTSSH